MDYGSLTEAVYLFRWIGYDIKLDDNRELELSTPFYRTNPVWIFGILTYFIAYILSVMVPGGLGLDIFYYPLTFVGFMFLIDKFLSVANKNTILIAAMAYYVWSGLAVFRMLFAIIFIGGGILILFAGYAKNGKRIGFYPFAMMMFAGLSGLLFSENILQFFISLELLTLCSFVLILRAKKSMPHALSYMLFFLGGTFLILAGFCLVYSGTSAGSISLDILKAAAQYSGIISAILLKAGMFGLVVLMLAMGSQSVSGVSLPYLFCFMSHTGWLTDLAFARNHFVFKALLLAV